MQKFPQKSCLDLNVFCADGPWDEIAKVLSAHQDFVKDYEFDAIRTEPFVKVGQVIYDLLYSTHDVSGFQKSNLKKFLYYCGLRPESQSATPLVYSQIEDLAGTEDVDVADLEEADVFVDELLGEDTYGTAFNFYIPKQCAEFYEHSRRFCLNFDLETGIFIEKKYMKDNATVRGERYPRTHKKAQDREKFIKQIKDFSEAAEEGEEGGPKDEAKSNEMIGVLALGFAVVGCFIGYRMLS